MNRNALLLVLFAGACGPFAAAAPPAPSSPTATLTARTWFAVSDRKLGTLRGGFALGGGVVASFAISRAVYINDQLVTQTSLNFGRVTDLTPAQSAELSRQLSQVNVVQNGPRNVVDLAPGTVPMGLVIQNSLNNQNIRQQTVIDVSSNSMSMIKGLNTQATIADGLARANAPR